MWQGIWAHVFPTQHISQHNVYVTVQHKFEAVQPVQQTPIIVTSTPASLQLVQAAGKFVTKELLVFDTHSHHL